MANYLLYGTKLIEDDSTLESFAKCILDGVPVDDLKEAEQRYCDILEDTEYEDVFMERVHTILVDDISRTDIDYVELMGKYAVDIGILLYDMENHGYDLSTLNLTFFGKEAADCFNKLIEEKVWFMKFYD